MKKLMLLCSLILLIACSKEGSFTLETFDSVVRQSSSSSKGMPNTEIVTTINGVSHTLNLEQDLFYDLDEDEFVHLLQQYRVEFEVEDTAVSVVVFFDVLTDRENNTVVTNLPDGQGGFIPVENKMTININGEMTEVNVENATVNYPRVRFDDGQYSFDISL
ncbi:MAG: hypothetical protein ACPG8F_06130 [Flavobacteriaceae bacterium]